MKKDKLETVTVGGGCFWCVEAVINQIKGVEEVVSGYMGGIVPGTPTYREVCSGLTGHAEVVQATFNPEIISYKELLMIFMTSHNPTTLNRQGGDIGTQYRSVIFYHNEQQELIAQKVVEELTPYYEDAIVTEISPASRFYPAEDYHQNYYENNKDQIYCSMVISPKLAKLKKLYDSKLKNKRAC
ncbi:peptide-methionine (S)-S-oxide reductase MsrA [Tenacibaculum tangerinum]|uniref:Peptide methionine sulfoxide reductase MsrA n=1 Tax=Tenacibaculum tangerinum TaxID=3038772 RepID=A0ABY8L585_9FLAO|nr:peptide-methionine (S)-S-oxide reductase MsrA [Tenacibaculum tangerinum]WGH76246.1 peptide-methionine (S)-S-oxide reductase MsrA [Tenacibaculum tangerinum]